MLLALIPAALRDGAARPRLRAWSTSSIALAVLFVAGTPWRHFAALFALGAVAIALVARRRAGGRREVLQPYQKERLTAFLQPVGQPCRRRATSRTSRGSRSAPARRPAAATNATQTKLNFLPEHHTDFIFAVVGERWGFVGAALVLSLYALLIWRGLRILTDGEEPVRRARRRRHRRDADVPGLRQRRHDVGIMPITGIPLPLMSYGGSSVLTTLLAIGLLQSIYAQGRAAASLKGRVLAL